MRQMVAKTSRFTITRLKNNANNGFLCVGGINNVIALNQTEGNWSAGVMPWHVSNTVVRDNYLLNNNRSAFNGIGNDGDALGSCILQAIR